MSLILDGSVGVSDVDGSAATPAIRGTDANTGMFFPAADTIAFAEGGSESMRIDSSGNVGIGTSSPLGKLDSSWGGRTAGQVPAILVGANSDSSTRSDNTQKMGVIGAAHYTNAQSPVGLISSNSYASNNDVYVGGGFAGSSAATTVSFWTAANNTTTQGTERMRIDSSGNVGIGTSSPSSLLTVKGEIRREFASNTALYTTVNYDGISVKGAQDAYYLVDSGRFQSWYTGASERMRITSSGVVLVGKTASALGTAGAELKNTGTGTFTVSGDECVTCNRLTSDGRLIAFYQDTVEEGTITVSGTTVSYNGGHLSRWAQTLTPKDESLVKGTVLSNLDEMNEYVDAEGNPVSNEQLNKVKVSDVEGDVNVAGVFVNWSHDEQHNVDEINMAMTGDMIIRIAQDVVVQKGNLLMSAGNGTAKPQGDDIVRSKTVAKVTSNHVTCTYADGSYCVPCVLMAC